MSLAPPAAPHFDLDLRPSPALYLSVGLVAGAVIALQICIMRLFSVGSWAHFGSLVVSLAMLGFGLTSAVMCIGKDWFERHWRRVAAASLLLFGPLIVAANLLAQQIPFNAIFLISDPMQKWRLFGNFMLYMLPFLAGAFFLGTVFLKANKIFGRVYFADLSGSGLCGLAFLVAMYVTVPDNLIVVPLLLWLAGSVLWFVALADRRNMLWVSAVAAASIAAHFVLPPLLDIPKLAVSDYKGVSYARKFPDSQRVYESTSPFGYLEVYSSSYLHFAPGLSDNAAFNLPKMPANAYLGMYIDGEGPSGIIRDLPADQTAYFRFLPMIYPYLIKEAPDTFVVQFGGGISTSVALHSKSRSVTVAEGNPAVLHAFRTDKGLRDFTGDVLNNPKVRVIDYDGRLYLAYTKDRYDVIDLSLANSAGLSSPGGFAIVEKFSYTREAMKSYMRALKDGGILSVTLWNKEEPPKSVLKLYTTMAGAAREVDDGDIANRFFVVSTYLSTATVLYKRGGFTPEEIAKLRAHTRGMSFDEIYYPGFEYDQSQTASVLEDYQAQVFSQGEGLSDNDPTEPSTAAEAAGGDKEPAAPEKPASSAVPATTMGQLTWHHLVHGGWDGIADRYVFDTRMLTNNRPYFAAYVKPGDLPRTTDRLELFQDEWGYLLLWATLAIACLTATSLVLIPLVFGWRTIFSHNPGKFRTIIYFALPGRGLHHGRGRLDLRIHAGVDQCDGVRLGADHRDAGVLRSRQLRVGALSRPCAHRDAEGLHRDRRPAHWLRALPRSRARPDRHASLRAATDLLLCADPAARLSDGLPDADGDDVAGAARQGSHVPVGVGHQRLLLGDRGCHRADRRDVVRLDGGAHGGRRCLSGGDARVLRRAAADQTLSGVA